MAFSYLGKNIFIGDSAATSHMTSNKMGVYNLIPINGSVMIGNGQSISCTHKGQLYGWRACFILGLVHSLLAPISTPPAFDLSTALLLQKHEVL